jgi:ABC-type nickel/cobalt efflux system permease component RcnA
MMIYNIFLYVYYLGISSVWFQQFVTAGLLFALCCSGSVLYTFFGDWWNISESSVYPDESNNSHPQYNADNEEGKDIEMNNKHHNEHHEHHEQHFPPHRGDHHEHGHSGNHEAEQEKDMDEE